MYFIFPPKQVIFIKWQLGVHLTYIQEYAATDRFSKSYVEQLEKQVGEASRSASSFPLGSCIFRHSAPDSEIRTLSIQGPYSFLNRSNENVS